MHRINRRDLLCAAAAAMLAPGRAAGAERANRPVIGFLSGTSPDGYAPFLASFRDGLAKAGFVEGGNVAIEYRWAEGAFDRLPGMAEELVGRRVDLLVTSGSTLAAVAARKATERVPTVFLVGDDPVAAGLVVSMARPGGNRTGLPCWSSI